MHVGISTPCNIREYKQKKFNACSCKVFLFFLVSDELLPQILFFPKFEKSVVWVF